MAEANPNRAMHVHWPRVVPDGAAEQEAVQVLEQLARELVERLRAATQEDRPPIEGRGVRRTETVASAEVEPA